MEYFGQTQKRYILEQKAFKQGGEGSVYNVVNSQNDNIVAKIYHPKVLTAELAAKIKYMASNPPSASILDQIAWPKDCLYDNVGHFVGFIMPKLKIDAELGELYKYPARNIKLNNDQKVVLAINICRVIAEVHKAGYVFGDFNPCNIGVNLSKGNVAFLDTDSYHIYDKANNKLYRCVVCATGYVAPELIKQCKGTDFKSAPLPTFTQETDRFALAIHIFKLLFNGMTPYNGIPEGERASQASPGLGNVAIERDSYCFKPGNKPQSMATPPMEAFPDELQELFTRAFIVGRYDAKLRPTAEEWDRALTNYRSQLVQCGNDPLHYFYNKLASCPYCEADQRYNTVLSLMSVYGSSSAPGSTGQIPFSTPVAVPPSTPTHNSTPTSTGSSHGLSQSVSNARKRAKKTGFRRKFKIALISILCAFIVLGGAGGGIYYKFSLDAIQQTQTYISYIPESGVADFSQYDGVIAEAYTSYNQLASWQQERVSNRDILLAVIPQYNEYKVNALRETAALVTTETVSSTTYLADSVTLYQNLWDEQKALLSREEVNEYENLVKVKRVIDEIQSIDDDLVNKYHMVDDTRVTYYSISEAYRPLVYNYNLVEGFEEQMAFLNSLTFTEVDGGYEVKANEGVSLEGDIVIPDRYNNTAVVSIAENGFANQRRLTSVVVPDTVLTIGVGAFQGCNALQSMSLPFTGKSVNAEAYEAVFGFIFGYTRIQSSYSSDPSSDFTNSNREQVDGAVWQFTSYNGENANYSGSRKYANEYFYNIPTSLKEVTITNQREVQTAAFNGCTSLTKIIYTQMIENVGAAACQNCERLISFNTDNGASIYFDSRCYSIGDSAFRNCREISHLTLSPDTTEIQANAFSGCNGIQELTLPRTLSSIGDYAFQDMRLITSVVVPDTVLTIGVGAFQGCNALQSMSLPFTGKSVNAEAYEAVFGFIFGYTRIQSSYSSDPSSDFTNSNREQVDGAVWQFTSYNGENANYSGSRKYANEYFYNIPTSLKEVTITNQREVQTAAFNGCTMLTKITYTQGILSQGDYAFQNCSAQIVR